MKLLMNAKRETAAQEAAAGGEEARGTKRARQSELSKVAMGEVGRGLTLQRD